MSPGSSLLDFSSARVLLTNDDGVEALGLKILQEVIKPFVKEVFIVAPELEQSGASHSLTLRQPLRIRKISDNRYAVQGTPTDAVLLGISTRILWRRSRDPKTSKVNFIESVAKPHTMLPRETLVLQGS